MKKKYMYIYIVRSKNVYLYLYLHIKYLNASKNELFSDVNESVNSYIEATICSIYLFNCTFQVLFFAFFLVQPHRILNYFRQWKTSFLMHFFSCSEHIRMYRSHALAPACVRMRRIFPAIICRTLFQNSSRVTLFHSRICAFSSRKVNWVT